MRKFLFPISLIFYLISNLRNWFYDLGIFKIYEINKNVISVGNITAGGTGKTPTVEYLIEYLMKRNKKIAVISRGYKRKTSGSLLVSDGKNILQNSENSGDEPFQIAMKYRNCIVGVDENRYRMAEYISGNYNIDVILLDDAFQHRKIKRNFDVVCFNAAENPFKELILPAGNRREKINGLKRADFILFNKCNEENNTMIIKSEINRKFKLKYADTRLKPEYFMDFDGNKYNLNYLENKKCIVFSGIANQNDFYLKLKNLNIRVEKFIPFPDHHNYSSRDIERVISELKNTDSSAVITTEKDFFRMYNNRELIKYFDENFFYYLCVKMEFISSEEVFINAIEKVINYE